MNRAKIYEAELCLTSGEIETSSRCVNYEEDWELDDYTHVAMGKVFSSTKASENTARYLCVLRLQQHIAELITKVHAETTLPS